MCGLGGKQLKSTPQQLAFQQQLTQSVVKGAVSANPYREAMARAYAEQASILRSKHEWSYMLDQCLRCGMSRLDVERSMTFSCQPKPKPEPVLWSGQRVLDIESEKKK